MITDDTQTNGAQPASTDGKRVIAIDQVEDIAVDGVVLGDGGGGSLPKGIEFGELAVEYDRPTIVSVAGLDLTDVVLTVSSMGALATTESHVDPADYVRAVELLVDRLTADGMAVDVLMTNEIGGFAIVNDLLRSAVTGFPFVDAACNGWTYPTGSMSSIGLSQGAESAWVAVDGVPDIASRLEAVVEAELGAAASLVRHAAKDTDDLVAAACNSASASYIETYAALGTYDQAETISRAVRLAGDGRDAAERIAEVLDGEVLLAVPVESLTLETTGGFDTGEVEIRGRELTLWNEYVTLELGGEHLATSPDLTTTLDAEAGMPVSTTELVKRRSMTIVAASTANLPLGVGTADPTLFDLVEQAVGKAVKLHVFN